MDRAGSKKGYSTWNYVCDCGNRGVASSNDLLQGNKKSRNCLQAEHRSRHCPGTTHGHTASPDTTKRRASKEYNAWAQIKQRYFNENDQSYKKHRGEGIEMDSKWRESFEAFLEDVRLASSEDLWLIRIDKSKGYFSRNVRWGKPIEAKWGGGILPYLDAVSKGGKLLVGFKTRISTDQTTLEESE